MKQLFLFRYITTHELATETGLPHPECKHMLDQLAEHQLLNEVQAETYVLSNESTSEQIEKKLQEEFNIQNLSLNEYF